MTTADAPSAPAPAAGATSKEEPSNGNVLLGYFRKFFLCLAYIICSAALIRYNKYLMHKEHFPHSMALAACHMIVSSVACGVLYLVLPGMFPAM
eukprot:CAMPEP_0168454608 /NCGR_PEP_ID=MMETSP0228-20121227/50306_1 /TAXON_ID=133427 /ORGANISM="Protoceratium reticulatum, Strain CCCM 535 (=CCMP 1889)" /LENGTH=93 /DNA_ID=CAMNT_0008469395 /DNA_START=18 /DNA_END=296 /DNA_ORIENTATION=+